MQGQCYLKLHLKIVIRGSALAKQLSHINFQVCTSWLASPLNLHDPAKSEKRDTTMHNIKSIADQEDRSLFRHHAAVTDLRGD